MGSPQLLTAKQLARIFQLDKSSIYRLAAAGKIPAIRIPSSSEGGRETVRFVLDEVLSALRAA